MGKLYVSIRPTRTILDCSKLDGPKKYFVLHTIQEFCRTKLTTVKKINRYSHIAWVKDKEYFNHTKNDTFIIPVSFYDDLKRNLISKVEDLFINEEIITPDYNKFEFKLNAELKDRPDQIDPINYLLSIKGKRGGLEFKTGGGKTYMAARVICNYDTPALIVVNGLTEQWLERMKQYITNSDKSIYLIQGHKSIDKLFDKNINPKLFVCSIGTLRKYVLRDKNYINLPTYEEFIERFGIGVKIVDEAHLWFHATSLIDLAGDINTNIYMTATFLTANVMLKRLFGKYFPHQMRYNGEVGGDHTKMFIYSYPGVLPTKKTISFGKYMHSKFEKMMLWNKRGLMANYFNNVIFRIIDAHYINVEYPNKKLLIFVYMQRTALKFKEAISQRYPDYNVDVYITGSPDSIFKEKDIIISTPKGAGVGKDIPNLITVINTVSFGAETLARQMVGRLREIKNFKTQFIHVIDGNNSVHQRHKYNLKRILRNFVKDIKELYLWL